MSIFDFNIHLPKPNEKEQVSSEQNSSFEEIENLFLENLDLYTKNFTSFNFMLFNSHMEEESIKKLKILFNKHFENSTITLLIDLNEKRELKDLKNAGIDFIKFHSYVQNIDNSKFDKCIKLSQEAQQNKMGILVDCSYGSLDMFLYDNILLSIEIAKNIKNTPIILLHSGGKRVLDAMLIAHSCDNVFLETSFTPAYYQNSSIYEDLIFAYKKIPEKIIYASDWPYVTFDNSISTINDIFQKGNFSQNQIDNILYKNVKNIIRKLN